MSAFPTTAIGWKMRALWGGLKLDTWGVRVGKIISLIIIIGFSIGATYFFTSVFRNLLALEGIGQPLLWRVIGITQTTVFALLVVSNMITGIATLYRSTEIPFMIAKPMPYRAVFMSQFSDNLAYSSWSLAVLGIPLILAWGIVFKVAWWWVAAAVLLGLWPMIIISAVAGATALMCLVWVARVTSPRIAGLLVILVVAASIAGAVINRNRGFIVEGAARKSNVERYLSGLSREAKAPALPSGWLTASMRAVTRGDFKRSLFLTGLLSMTGLVFLRWLSVAAGKTYYKSWTAFNEMTGRSARGEPISSARAFTNGRIPNPVGAMLRKDLLQFSRSPSQWAQFLILSAFLLIYLLNLVYVSTRFNFDAPYWKTMVLFLNFAFSGFILATLSVRFVFPLISLEGRGFWVVRSAPVTTKLIFWEKFFLAFIVFMGLCELIVLFSNKVLHVEGMIVLLTTTAIFLMGATLTGLGIGMGAIFPDFKDESPMRIASSPGGVLTVVISLVYVGLMVAILAWPARGYFLYLMGRAPFPAERAVIALLGVLLLNAIALVLPIRLGYKMLSSRDL